MDEHMMAAQIAALKSEIETLRRQVEGERSKVIAEVREYVNAWAGYLPGVGMQVSSNSVLKKLDSMDKG